MSGRFTKLRYDQDAYNDSLSRSTDPLLYKLDPHYANNCNPCFAAHGPRNSNTHTMEPGQKIDVDSILRGVNKINSKSINGQIPDSLQRYHTTVPIDCSNAFEQSSSRYTHPIHENKGLNTSDMRLSYPLHDPQCNIFENFSVDTRLQAKDNHKTIWQVPINQRDALPTERGRTKKCTITVNCGYAPYQQ